MCNHFFEKMEEHETERGKEEGTKEGAIAKL